MLLLLLLLPLPRLQCGCGGRYIQCGTPQGAKSYRSHIATKAPHGLRDPGLGPRLAKLRLRRLRQGLRWPLPHAACACSKQ